MPGRSVEVRMEKTIKSLATENWAPRCKNGKIKQVANGIFKRKKHFCLEKDPLIPEDLAEFKSLAESAILDIPPKKPKKVIQRIKRIIDRMFDPHIAIPSGLVRASGCAFKASALKHINSVAGVAGTLIDAIHVLEAIAYDIRHKSEVPERTIISVISVIAGCAGTSAGAAVGAAIGATIAAVIAFLGAGSLAIPAAIIIGVSSVIGGIVCGIGSSCAVEKAVPKIVQEMSGTLANLAESQKRQRLDLKGEPDLNNNYIIL